MASVTEQSVQRQRLVQAFFAMREVPRRVRLNPLKKFHGEALAAVRSGLITAEHWLFESIDDEYHWVQS